MAFVIDTSKTLRSGDRGNQVTHLQHALNGLGYFTGTEDGAFGGMTKAGVVLFQTASGLEADGIAGKGTFKALIGALTALETQGSDVQSAALAEVAQIAGAAHTDLVNWLAQGSELGADASWTADGQARLDAAFEAIHNAAGAAVG